MLNQTEQSPGIQSLNSLVPQDPSQADPGVVKVMQAIKNVETPGAKDPYTAVGDSGESHGAYQFNKNNYKNWASQYGLDPNDFSPAAQNKVAYARIKDLKDQGLQPEEIAAKWNGAKRDPATGKLTYINPQYGVKFRNALLGNQTQQPSQPNISASQEEPAAHPPQPEDQESVLHKLIDFAFPIVNDFSGEGAKKTALQKLGDAGLSALWFVPGVGEGAEAAIRGAGLVGKGVEAARTAKIAGQAIGGAATGYGADVSSNLSQGKTGKEAFTPGFGTATGGVLGGALGKLGTKYSQEGVLNEIGKSNNSVIGQTKRGANELAESFSEDKNPGALLAQKGINVAHTVNPETVAFDTAHHAEGLRQDANTLTDTLTEALKRVPGSTSATDLETRLVNKITSEAPDKITAAEQASLIKSEFEKIRAQYGEQLSAADMNELKKRAWNLSKFDAATPNLVRKTQRLIGNNLKTSVEDAATKAGLPEVKAMNEYIGQHLDAADHLDRLNGTKAKGGRLGDMLKSQAGTMIGGAVGFPAGPAGALMGALIGHYGGKVAGSAVRKIASSPVKTAILNRIVQEDPEIVQKVLAYAKQTPQGLQAIEEQLGQQGIKLFKKPTKGVPVLKAKPYKPGILSDVLTKAAVKGVTQ